MLKSKLWDHISEVIESTENRIQKLKDTPKE